MRSFASTHLWTLLWAVLTAVALLAPGSSLERVGTLPDGSAIGAHFVLFLVLTLLLWRSLRAPGWRRPLGAAFLIAFAYGGALEAIQIAIEGRAAEWLDLVTNAAGGLVAVWAVRLSGRRVSRAD